MLVMKFGGTSLGTPERIQGVLDVVAEARESIGVMAIVCSAFGGATDALFRMGMLASQGDSSYQTLLEALRKRHEDAVSALIAEQNQPALLQEVQQMLADLEDVLHGVYLIRELTKRTQDFISSFGERLSSRIIAEALKTRIEDAAYLDAREVVKTDESFGAAKVDFVLSNRLIHEHFSRNKGVQVITGYIAQTADDKGPHTTTLGRGGSDYTASILAAALEPLGCSEIQIWTDVDGMMTADPRKVSEAIPIANVTYEEAMELAHFGAKVLYPPTMAPALAVGLPIRIKNTFKPEAAGTLVGKETIDQPQHACGISSIERVSLLQLKGCGLFGVAGICNRLFGALAASGVNVILISQGSSEHSICFAVAPDQADLAKTALETAFEREMASGQVEPVRVDHELSIVAVVGEGMRNQTGVAARVFRSMGDNRINVIAIAQGSSELNISFVVRHRDMPLALNVLHDAFFVPRKKLCHLFLVGTGLIGKRYLELIAENAKQHADHHGVALRLVGVANSRKMLLREGGLEPIQAINLLAEEGQALEPQALAQAFKSMQCTNKLFVDCTASEQATEIYEELLESGISVVTPNKKANTGCQQRFDRLRQLGQAPGVRFFYEANVGAALPVINTLQSLVAAGDRVHRIEAILSGSLSYIFNSFNGEVPFSQVIAKARELGFTEPDPREDLSGMDVARKLLILAREAGFQLELQDLRIDSLIDDACRNAQDQATVFEALKNLDPVFESRRARAAKEGLRLRYIATWSDGKGQVSLQEVGPDHPCYYLEGADNLISFTTDFYPNTPLVIKGAGAGATVTASQVLAETIRVAMRV